MSDDAGDSLSVDERHSLVQLYLSHLSTLEDRGEAGAAARVQAKRLAATEMSELAGSSYDLRHVEEALRLSVEDDLGVI